MFKMLTFMYNRGEFNPKNVFEKFLRGRSSHFNYQNGTIEILREVSVPCRDKEQKNILLGTKISTFKNIYLILS